MLGNVVFVRISVDDITGSIRGGPRNVFESEGGKPLRPA